MRYLLVLLLGVTFLTGCRKGPGVGGKATIQGKVYVHYYNSTGTSINFAYYGADEDVYIVYGDDVVYSDKVSTGYDGTYRFDYLLPGDYKIYVYSKDVTGQSGGERIPIIIDVEITDKNQVIELEDIVIDDN